MNLNVDLFFFNIIDSCHDKPSKNNNFIHTYIILAKQSFYSCNENGNRMGDWIPIMWIQYQSVYQMLKKASLWKFVNFKMATILVHFQMVWFCFWMSFKFRTIHQSNRFGPSETRTCLVFVPSLYSISTTTQWLLWFFIALFKLALISYVENYWKHDDYFPDF